MSCLRSRFDRQESLYMVSKVFFCCPVSQPAVWWAWKVLKVAVAWLAAAGLRSAIDLGGLLEANLRGQCWPRPADQGPCPDVMWTGTPQAAIDVSRTSGNNCLLCCWRSVAASQPSLSWRTLPHPCTTTTHGEPTGRLRPDQGRGHLRRWQRAEDGASPRACVCC